MSKGKVKLEVTHTYYFSLEQWNRHDRERVEKGISLNELLDEVCLPYNTVVSIDMSEIQGEKEDKKETLLG